MNSRVMEEEEMRNDEKTCVYVWYFFRKLCTLLVEMEER